MTGGARYPVPAGRHRVEQSIERSRFIATSERVTSAEEAHAFIRAVGSEFADATHNCWAFVAGPPGSTSQIGMSDDGEPHGTAGRPMLTVLLHAGVGEIAVVVTRYFGGIKLGTGGLARAYSSSVSLVLESLPRTERVDWQELSILASYSSISSVRQLLEQFDGEVVHEEFATDVTFHVRVPAPHVDALRAAIGDATRGQAIVDERLPGD